MKLTPTPSKAPKPKPQTARDRLVEDVRTQLYRLTVQVDEIKAEGTVDDLDAAEKILWAAVRMLDTRKVR
jgi:hypothetical protein